MRKSTVKLGLNLVVAGIVSVTLATFYHDQLAWLLLLPPEGEVMLIYLGFLWGGVFSCAGILVAVTGLLRGPTGSHGVNLAPTLILLAAAATLYLFLFYSSITSPGPQRLAPGETITI